MDFSWDPDKAASNLRRHEVSFHEAATVFGNFLSRTMPDPDHSLEENRYIIVGHSDRNRLLSGTCRTKRSHPNHQCAGTHTKRKNTI